MQVIFGCVMNRDRFVHGIIWCIDIQQITVLDEEQIFTVRYDDSAGCRACTGELARSKYLSTGRHFSDRIGWSGNTQ